MARGEFFGAKTTAELAAEWGISMTMAHEYVAAARDVLRFATQESRESIVAEVLAGIDAIRSLATNKTKVWVTKAGERIEVPDPDCKAALQAIELRCRLIRLLDDKDAGAPAQLSFPSAREALAFVETIMPRLREQAGAEVHALTQAESTIESPLHDGRDAGHIVPGNSE